MIGEKDIDGLEKYIDRISEKKVHNIIYSVGHPIADAIINDSYEKLASERNIDFQIMGKLPKSDDLSDIDICIIFSNLLNNAVEAIKKFPEDIQASLNVFINVIELDLVITVENSSLPYDRQNIADINTSKPDHINHGFGLKNIKSTVKKYDGYFSLEYQNDMCVGMVCLRGIGVSNG